MLVGELELIFDDETIILREGDTMTVAPNVWHEAKSVDGGKMLTIFKNSEFDLFLEELSTMSEGDFANQETMKACSEKYDIYEA